MRGSRAASLVVRVWVDAESGVDLRARIIAVDDSSAVEEQVAVASSADELLAAVSAWLERFRAGAPEA